MHSANIDIDHTQQQQQYINITCVHK